MSNPAKQVAVAIIPDLQKKNFDTQSHVTAYNQDRMKDVRRPTRGIQIKEDTYATISVMLADGTYIPLVNAGSRNGQWIDDKYHSEMNSNFLIQAVREERVEKTQIVETFGEAFIFFYGERPRVLSINGILINTFDFNWEAEWWWNYDNYLRGTKCVEKQARVYLMYDETLVSGYIMSSGSAKEAEQKNFVPFQFTLFVTDYTSISRLGDPDPDPNAMLATGESNQDLQGLYLYGPQRLPVGMIPREISAAGGDVLTKLSLFEAMTSQAISAVQNTWQKVNQVVDNVLLSADAMLGGPVRIPVGFQGALAFDENTFVQGEPGLSQPIRYTSKFGDNDDEFVGSSAQYGSSSMAFGKNLNDEFIASSTFDSQDAMMDEATLQWAENGLFVPPAAVTKAVGLLSKTGIGMQVLKGARSGVATAGTAVQVAEQAANPIIAGALDVMGGAALAAGVAADAPAAAQQFSKEGTALGLAAQEEAMTTAGAVDRAARSGVDVYKGFTADANFKPVIGGQAGEFTGTATPVPLGPLAVQNIA